jgi:hypothetical protein
MPSKKYNDIIETIDNKNKIDKASSKMKDELKQYMASLINNNDNKKDTTNIDNLETISSNDNNFSYSSY